MLKKESKEWHIDAPWGKIAMVSWGSSSLPPVLMVHGYMDTAATFTLLADHLLEEYYYVAFDLPGHGKSDPFPPGQMVNQVHIVEVLRTIVDHMGWKLFVCMAHSMAVVIAFIYNTVYPGLISRMICLDPEPGLCPYYEINHAPHIWYKRYNLYYESYYYKTASDNPKLYKYDKIVSLLGNNRQLTREQAEVVLSRSLVETQDGLYSLTWEPRVKWLTSLALSPDNLLNIMINNTTPTLITISSINKTYENAKIITSKIMNEFHRSKNCSIVNIEGHHDVYITSPDKMAAIINEFLKNAFYESKL